MKEIIPQTNLKKYLARVRKIISTTKNANSPNRKCVSKLIVMVLFV
jgi:hypothetical protein